MCGIYADKEKFDTPSSIQIKKVIGMLRKSVIVLGTFFAVLLSVCVQTMTAEEVLNKVVEKYDKIEGYRAEIHDVVIDGSKRIETDIYVAFKKPGKLRIEDPYTITIVNSSKMLIYNKTSGERKVVEINVSIPDVYYGYFLNMLKDGNVSLAGEEEVAGKRCYVLTTEAGSKNVRIEKVWITRDWCIAKLQLRIIMEMPNETRETTDIIEFRKLEFGKIDDSMFEVE